MSGGKDFDLIVIGGGSGGLAGALRAAGHGARVALFEPGALGGTCVNLGCVPKKAMWLAAQLAHGIDTARALGFGVPADAALDWTRLLAQREAYIADIRTAYAQRLSAAGITVVPQRAQLDAAPGTVVCADGTRLRARHILLATGAHARRPDIPGAELGGVSDDFFALDRAPQRFAVIGAGYIGVELCGVLQALGTRCELFMRQARPLPGFDAEITARLAESMQQAGIVLHPATEVTALRRAADGRIQVRAHAQVFDGFDHVLFAVGRAPNSAGLGLETAGVRLDARGRIEVDAWQDTSVAGIHAVGDVTPQPALTPHAIAAARRLMDRLFAGEAGAAARFEQIPTVVFSHPPLGKVGLTEAEARQLHGDEVAVVHADFRPMLHALAGSGQRSLFKLVCHGPQRRVLGIHLLGEGCDEMLQGFAVAMRLGLTLDALRETLAIHPTSAEEVVLA